MNVTEAVPVADDLARRVIETRRDLHRFPELGLTEFRTAGTIAARLQDLGIDVRAGRDVMEERSIVGRPSEAEMQTAYDRARDGSSLAPWLEKFKGGLTGVVGTLRGLLPGPVVALRCDTDALPIIECAESDHYPAQHGFESAYRGVMHACGHDAHVAIGLAVAEVLSAMRERIHGTIKFVFQPAEEGGRGAVPMKDAGVVDDVDYLIAIHIGTNSESGVFYPVVHGHLASVKFDVTFKGRASHAGGRPEEGRNALLGAAQAVMGLYAISRHHAGRSRVNVGVMRAGSGRNVIPGDAFFAMEVRGETEDICDYMAQRAEQVIRGAAQAHDLQATIETVGRTTTASCDRPLAEAVARAAATVPGLRVTLDPHVSGGSEDATYLMRRVQECGGQAIYACVGSKTTSGHHTPRFDIEESDIVPAVRALATAILAVGEAPPQRA